MSDDQARIKAERDYYRHLFDKAKRALHHRGAVPAVPQPAELEFVDGCLIWRGRPVWPSAGEDVWVESPAGADTSDAARLRAVSRCADFVVRASRQLMTTNGHASPERIARFDAVQAFYRSLEEQVERARQGKAVIPEVPPRSELEFIDGWLVWKGRPVWWSGYRPDSASVPVSSTSVLAGGNATRPPARERPKLRRLLTLPWRRAAA